MIHPTAIVDADAHLGEGVEVGPYAVIGPKVAIGDGCVIESHVVMPSHVKLGKSCRVSSFASLGAPPQDLKFKGEDTWVEIGDGTIIREYVTVNRGTVGGGGATRVGSGVLLMACAHVAHDCHVGDRVIMANAAMLAGHVEVGRNAVIGAAVGIHQFVRIGEFSILGAMSGVPQDVPPYVTAVVARPVQARSLHGLNLIGLKRNGFSEETIAALKQAFRILFRSDLPRAEALAKVEADVPPLPEVKNLLDFIRTSKRGVLR